jgi:hypothetical protein
MRPPWTTSRIQSPHVQHLRSRADNDRMPSPGPARAWIVLRYPGRCAACSTPLPNGTRALHDRTARTVTCEGCATATSAARQLERGEAGASAAREYDRRRTARERRARKAFAHIGLGAIGVGMARLTEPDHQKAWARGTRGEQLVAQRLEALLADTDVLLLHDRRLPRSRTNIDHLAIGPGGVTVIDTKNYTGKIRTETRGGLLHPRTEHLLISGRDHTKLIDSARRQVAAIATILERAGQPVDVRGALCMANADGLPLLAHPVVSDIAVDGPKRIAKLARRNGALTPQLVHHLAHLFAQALPPA